MNDLKHLDNMITPSHPSTNLLFSSITLSLVMLSENSIASEGRIQTVTRQNVPPPNVDNPGKVSSFVSSNSKYII